MQKIRILTDSASDIPQDVASALGIRVLPIPIAHEGKSYSERVEMTDDQFYALLLGSKSVPTTSHITADTYLREYRRALEEGCTALLNVTINSLGSNMFEAAQLAKNMLREELGERADAMRIEVVDSRTYTIAYGVAVIRAAEMASRGEELDGILATLHDWFDRLEILFSVYSLDFVKKSGRVSCAAAFVGELLGLRPTILFADGVATVVDKIRGDRNVVPRLAGLARRRCEEPEGRRYPLLIVRGTPKAEGRQLFEAVAQNFGRSPDGIYSVGASIAINSGPKVVAVIYAGKKRVHS